MGLMRNYSMIVKVNNIKIARNDYFTEDALINDFLKLLNNSHIVHLADKGNFRETTTELYPSKVYVKTYELTVDIPPMEFQIKKKDKGNFIPEIFFEKIGMYRRKYEI